MIIASAAGGKCPLNTSCLTDQHVFSISRLRGTAILYPIWCTLDSHLDNKIGNMITRYSVADGRTISWVNWWTLHSKRYCKLIIGAVIQAPYKQWRFSESSWRMRIINTNCCNILVYSTLSLTTWTNVLNIFITLTRCSIKRNRFIFNLTLTISGRFL